MPERLQKILSQWGVASRRQAEQMILQGRIRLNGAVVHLGQLADPAIDTIEIDGKPLQSQDRPPLIYLLLHKPLGVVSACKDPWHRRTVLDLLPLSLRQDQGIHPVGRLDIDSTGALLLTNDGELTFSLTHPRHRIPKTYQVWVQGHPSKPVLQQWRHGIMLDGKLTLPAEIRVLSQQVTQTLLQIVLYEGRNRQIRKVAEQLGYPVIRLHRSAIGSIQLSTLPEGEYRYLKLSDVQLLQMTDQP
jgi:23S rRNA pseudouridine2605 synthase